VRKTLYRKFVGLAFGCAAGAVLCLDAGQAGPWAEAGDAQLRSDIEILANAGVIDDMTMTWPIPWSGILYRLDSPDALDDQPEYVQEAAARVRSRGMKETELHKLKASVSVDTTNLPDVVRGFDALGRQTAQGQVTGEYLWNTTALNLSLGAETSDRTDKQTFMPDGSYFAQRIGNAAIYAGYETHWWGPGWISSMILSNNARPVPQIGFRRLSTAAADSPWFSWIGPWQFELFVGVLDGPRIARNTIYNGVRFEFNPIRHLEIAIARTDEVCGTGHPCKPLAEWIDVRNNNGGANKVNDEASIEIKYNGMIGALGYEAYTQFMNEDGPNPFVNSGTSHLAGASVWLPLKNGIERLTVEYASSIATKDLWGGSIQYGFSYNDGQYTDGMRYRDRTLGFSLDDDSTLFSVQANYTDDHERSFSLTLDHATISNPHDPPGASSSYGANVVTTAPVSLNMLDGRISLPLPMGWRGVHLDLDGRVQDNQPRPDKGFAAAAELALAVNL
jgi:hypothetical protein